MAWLGKLFGIERKAVGDDASTFATLAGFAAATASGINLAPTQALNCQAFATGHRIRCETLGTLSLKFFRRKSNAAVEAVDHPLYRLLHDRPNPWTGACEFVMQLEPDTILHAHGYALANRVDGHIIDVDQPRSFPCHCDLRSGDART